MLRDRPSLVWWPLSFQYIVDWHITDNPTAPAFVRYWSNSGQWPDLALNGSVAIDPKMGVLASIGFIIGIVVRAGSEQPDARLCSVDLNQAGVLFQINALSDLGDLIKNSFAIGARA